MQIMVNAIVRVINKTGLHARPANAFVKAVVRQRDCSIQIRKAGKLFNAKSIVSVLSACIKCNDEIEIIVDGSNEEQVLNELISVVRSGLGEK
jgi:phosphocarrier protein